MRVINATVSASRIGSKRFSGTTAGIQPSLKARLDRAMSEKDILVAPGTLLYIYDHILISILEKSFL